MRKKIAAFTITIVLLFSLTAMAGFLCPNRGPNKCGRFEPCWTDEDCTFSNPSDNDYHSPDCGSCRVDLGGGAYYVVYCRCTAL